LSRILDVSTVRLRRWLRLSLIQPIASESRIPYFDFHQVAFIKQLLELVESGASLGQIQRGIEQAKRLLPRGESLTASWLNIARDGRVLLRLRDRLVDHTGQRYFDFDAAGDGESTLLAEAVRSSFHDLCDEGLALEDDGRLEEAAEAYRRALQLEPQHPTLHFDLGNVLFQLNRVSKSIAQFQEAVRGDPDFAMAWHNLGSVHAQADQWEAAERCLRKTLSLVPTYADSHFTLAEVLRRQGRHGEAAEHQHAYQLYSKADRLLSGREHLLRVIRADEG
jgi:tetratricopeptide (TPR) repeat protein